jgi:hypothetical protein
MSCCECVSCRDASFVPSFGGPSSVCRLALTANDAFTCYKGAHLLPGVLAWLAIVLHVVAFPLVSLWCVRRAPEGRWGWEVGAFYRSS